MRLASLILLSLFLAEPAMSKPNHPHESRPSATRERIEQDGWTAPDNPMDSAKGRYLRELMALEDQGKLSFDDVTRMLHERYPPQPPRIRGPLFNLEP